MTAPRSPMYADSAVPVPEARQAAAQFMVAAQRLPTLFSLEEDAYRLMAALEDADADDAVLEINAQLALVDQMLMEKTESYVSVIRSLEAMSAARKAEADRLRDRAATAAKHAEWLKNRLLVHMQTTGRDRIETARFTLSVRLNNPAVNVLDATAIPSTFNRTTITVAPDKVAILAYTKSSGEVVPGTAIERKPRLEIK